MWSYSFTVKIVVVLLLEVLWSYFRVIVVLHHDWCYCHNYCGLTVKVIVVLESYMSWSHCHSDCGLTIIIIVVLLSALSWCCHQCLIL